MIVICFLLSKVRGITSSSGCCCDDGVPPRNCDTTGVSTAAIALSFPARFVVTRSVGTRISVMEAVCFSLLNNEEEDDEIIIDALHTCTLNTISTTQTNCHHASPDVVVLLLRDSTGTCTCWCSLLPLPLCLCISISLCFFSFEIAIVLTCCCCGRK